jgi:multidrug efflux system membrane fusion protein
VDLQRYKELVAQDSAAKQQLDTQQSLVAQLEGTVATDAGLVSTARLNLQYTHIVAAIGGRAGLRQVDVGNYVTPGDASGIVVITQLQPITAIFPVPEDSVPALMQRVRGGAILQVEASNRSNTTLLSTGTLVTVDNQMDTTTGTVKLRASFDNHDQLLFPNQFVNIRLLVDTLHDQIIVPIAAIQHGSVNGVAGSFVYLVNPADSTVSVRAVTTGAADGERVAIAKGLAVGDVVVTEGGDRLRDGARVQLPGAPPGAAQRGVGNGRRNGRRGNNAPGGAAAGTGAGPAAAAGSQDSNRRGDQAPGS